MNISPTKAILALCGIAMKIGFWVQFISALVSYEGTDLHAVESAFREAVDDYLDLCQEQGERPEESFTGDLTVRAGTDLHREVARYCIENGVSLDAVIRDSLQAQLSGKITHPLG